MSNESVIYGFLQQKGLNNAQIAGIMGNFQVESNFSPSVINQNEQAIGIAQWEGGRRTALQNYANQTGTTESNLLTQLNFMWNELTQQRPSVLSQIKNTNDPGTVAAIWDAQYEVSSGSARNTRINDANSIYNQIASGGLTADTSATDTVMTDATGAAINTAAQTNTLHSGGSWWNPGTWFDGLAGGIDAVGNLANMFLWIFNVDHFIQFLLYVFGAASIATGLGMITFGAGHNAEGKYGA